MLSDKKRLELANDIDFTLAVINAEIENRKPLSQYSFQTIEGRINLLKELELKGFMIVKF